MPNKLFNIALTLNEPSRGKLRSMPMHFSRDANTGAAHVSFPLTLTKARALTPNLELNYHANQGNSVFGIGFDLSGILNITRSTHQGGVPYYDENDIFILSTAGELVRISSAEEKEIILYRPRLDTQFSIIEYHVISQSWLIKEANGVNHRLGETDVSQVNHISCGIYQWWVSETYDAHGNKIQYTYDKKYINNAVSFFLTHIHYGNYRDKNHSENFAFCCTLDYGENDALEKNTKNEPLWKKSLNDREDQFTHYRAGFGIVTTQLCQRILLHHSFEEANYLVKYWTIEYQADTSLSLVKSFQEIGCRSNSKNEYITKALSPAKFDFFGLNNKTSVSMQPFDLGKDVMLPGLGGTYQWIDLYRDGLSGILYTDEFTAWYWRSEGKGKFSPPKVVSPFPYNMNFGSPYCRIMRLGKEKKTALVISNTGSTGYYLLDEEKLHIADDQYALAFSSYHYFTHTPIAFTDTATESMDLAGTGKSDIVILDALFPHYYPASDSIEEGYATPKPLMLPKDFPTRSNINPSASLIEFVDIFGDGLLHRVKVDCDGIDIWPNLGYGKFGEKIHWNLPLIETEFDPACVFLTDIDGSGACDFVYASTTCVRAFLNHGRGFSQECLTLDFPITELYSHNDQLLFGDYLGAGATGVVLIKKDVYENRYYHGTFAAKKPYLLREMISSSGITTTFDYDTSMTSYVEDRNNHKLASTRLPFALPILSEMTVKDPITQVTIEKAYRYHYGEYDFIERRFFGFAYVEATRHEYIALSELNTDKRSEPIQKALTKSWYYNRVIDEAIQAFPRYNIATLTNEDIGQHYFKNNENTDGEALKYLNDNFYLNREVQFALHGHTLGHETWGQGSDHFGENFTASVPLCVQIEQYNVRCDKPPISYIQHGVFVLQSREHYRFVYEQQNDLPRISREVNIVFDDKNRVLMNVKLDYGRHIPLSKNLIDDIVLDNSTIDKLKDLQSITHAICHQMTYGSIPSNSGFQYLHLHSEQKTFDLSANNLTSTQTFSDIKTLAQNSTKLIRHHQQYYWDETKTGVAPLGNLGKFALKHHRRSLLGSQAEVQAWYHSLLKTTEHETVESMLIENGYLNDLSEQWWQSDVIQHYGDESHYYQLTEITNISEYGASPDQSLFQRTVVTRDQYQLAILNIAQYLTAEKSFETQRVMDYQSMKPTQIIDHNQNIHITVYDPLNQLLAETKFGKLKDDWIGNPLTNDPSIVITVSQLSDIAFTLYQQLEEISLSDLVEKSTELLGPWLSVYYHHHMIATDQLRYSVVLTQQQYKNRAIPLLAETPKTTIGISIHYVDGFDHALQTKQLTDNKDPNKRWLSSGIEIHSRTEKKLRQTLPNFSAIVQCDSILMAMDPAQSLVNEYDVAGELIQQTLPNGDRRRLICTAWYQVYYDQNVIQNKKLGEFALPSAIVIHFSDSAGNTTGALKITTEKNNYYYMLSCSRFDVLGRPISHQDARIRVPSLTITYNLLHQEVSHSSVDRGQETFLYNHQSTLTRRRIGNWLHQTEHDSWQRPISLNIYSDAQAPVTIEMWQYGETLLSPEVTNACGQIVQFANEESIFSQTLFDLNGHCLHSERTIALPAMTFALHETLKRNGSPQPYLKNINALNNWQNEKFECTREYDVFGNLIAECLPDGRVLTHTYNALMQLETINSGTSVESLSAVTEMTYQEAGFLATRKFGNTVISNYNYDQQTQRLTNIISENTVTNVRLQDHEYTFDPVGNITRLKLGELRLPIKQNVTTTLIENTLDYTYDNYYRLSRAQGLELTEKTIVSDARVIQQKLFTDEATLPIQSFTQTFVYDTGNNITGIQHFNTNVLANDNTPPSWQLGFDIQENSNQFATLTSSVNNEKIELENGKLLYDAAGNMQKLDEHTDINWDHTNQLRQFTDTKENVNEYYAYRGAAFQEVPFTKTPEDQTIAPYSPKFFGQAAPRKINSKPFAEYANRLYKITCFEKTDNSIEVIEQVFLGNYERKRIFNIANNITTLALMRHTLRVRDEESVFATHHVFECDLNGQEANQPILQGARPLEQWEYHLTDHLHSSLLDVDGQGNILSMEAYQAYGQIAFIQTWNAKQLRVKDYHYSSQMRDDVSGLYYYGARYYAPQFGRWLSPDPAGLIEGLNLYRFVKNNPASFLDWRGYQARQLRQRDRPSPIIDFSGREDTVSGRHPDNQQANRNTALWTWGTGVSYHADMPGGGNSTLTGLMVQNPINTQNIIPPPATVFNSNPVSGNTQLLFGGITLLYKDGNTRTIIPGAINRRSVRTEGFAPRQLAPNEPPEHTEPQYIKWVDDQIEHLPLSELGTVEGIILEINQGLTPCLSCTAQIVDYMHVNHDFTPMLARMSAVTTYSSSNHLPTAILHGIGQATNTAGPAPVPFATPLYNWDRSRGPAILHNIPNDQPHVITNPASDYRHSVVQFLDTNNISHRNLR